MKTALQADLKQNRAFNPSSEQSKDMIYSIQKKEVFRGLRDHSKIECHNCMTYWTRAIVYCTCGTCVRPSDKIRELISDRYDVLSIPNYVIKKGPSHGHVTGTQRGKEYKEIHIHIG